MDRAQTPGQLNEATSLIDEYLSMVNILTEKRSQLQERLRSTLNFSTHEGEFL